MKSRPDSVAQSTADPAEAIREQARRVRQSRHDLEEEVTIPPESEGAESCVPVDVEESPKQTRRRMRGDHWDKLKPALAKLLLTAIGGVLGTGGGVAWKASQPPPSEVALQKLRTELEAEKTAARNAEANCQEKVKETREADREAYKDLRSLMFEQVNNPLNQRLNSLEAWQAEQVRDAAARARQVAK